MARRMVPLIYGSNILWIWACLASLSMLVYAPMLLDAPGSEKSVLLRLAYFGLISFPISTLVSILGSWLAFSKKLFRTTVFFMWMPVGSIAYTVSIFGILETVSKSSLASRFPFP